MNYIYLLLGISIFVLNLSDFLVTVFSPKGAGIVTDRVNIYGSKLYSLIVGKRGNNKWLDYKVIFLIISIIITWIMLTWISCSLIYLSDGSSIINSETKQNGSMLEKIYFTGYTLSTLGPGEFKPNGNLWMLFTNLVTYFGFFIITICITYIVPLVNNLTQAKALSLRIAGMGESTNALLLNSFNGKNFEELSSQFPSLANDILKYVTNHLAYPILDHVHNSTEEENIILKIASLDEALMIMAYIFPKEYNKHPLGLQQIRRAISTYINTLKNIQPANEAPPLPDFKKLKKFLPVPLIPTNEEQLNKIYNRLEKRRKLHKSNLENDGWKWSDIVTEKYGDIENNF